MRKLVKISENAYRDAFDHANIQDRSELLQNWNSIPLQLKSDLGCMVLDFASLQGDIVLLRKFTEKAIWDKVTMEFREKAFYTSAKLGDVEFLKSFIKFLEANYTDFYSCKVCFNAICKSIENNKIEAIAVLFERLPNYKRREVEIPGDPESENYAKMESVKIYSVSKFFALHYAVKVGNLEAVNFFINKGIKLSDVEKAGKELNALLSLSDAAAISCKVEVLEFLFNNGIKIENTSYNTPLHFAILYTKHLISKQMLHTLLSAGVNINASFDAGLIREPNITISHPNHLQLAICCGKINVIRMLLDAGAAPNHAAIITGETALDLMYRDNRFDSDTIFDIKSKYGLLTLQELRVLDELKHVTRTLSSFSATIFTLELVLPQVSRSSNEDVQMLLKLGRIALTGFSLYNISPKTFRNMLDTLDFYAGLSEDLLASFIQ